MQYVKKYCYQNRIFSQLFWNFQYIFDLWSSLDCPMSQHMSRHQNTTKHIQQTTYVTTLNATYNIGNLIFLVHIFYYSERNLMVQWAKAPGYKLRHFALLRFDPQSSNIFFHEFYFPLSVLFFFEILKIYFLDFLNKISN